MTQKEKQLLLKDICERLPYCGLMVRWGDEDFNIIGVCFGRVALLKPFMSIVSGSPLVEEVKPYLRPMTSMTEEELKEFRACHCVYDMHPDFQPMMCNIANEQNMFDWLLAHHFDYRGLIPMGLALEAKEGMYKTK